MKLPPQTQRPLLPQPASYVALVVKMLIWLTAIGATPAFANVVDSADLHLRFGVGIAAAQAVVRQPNTTANITAAGLLDGVQLGRQMTGKWALFFEANSLTLLVDSPRRDAQSHAPAKTKGEIIYGVMTGLGIGGHFTTAMLYLSGAIGSTLNNVSVNEDGVSFDDRRVGLGISAMAGKDWRIDGNWSLGLGAQLLLMVNQTSHTNNRGSYIAALGAMVSVTRH